MSNPKGLSKKGIPRAAEREGGLRVEHTLSQLPCPASSSHICWGKKPGKDENGKWGEKSGWGP